MRSTTWKGLGVIAVIAVLLPLGCEVGSTPKEVIVIVTATSQQSELLPTATLRPTSTATRTATLTPSPSVTPTAAPSVDISKCNAAFVADVTIPDGTVIETERAFEKTWRIRNSGSITWTQGFELTRVGGEPMGAPSSVRVPDVAPGEPADVTVPMVAPSVPGRYRSEWRMCVNEQCFGTVVFARIVAAPPTPTTVPTARRPVLDLSPAELRNKKDEITELQWEAYVKSLRGKRVRWTGRVINVYSAGTVSVMLESGRLFKIISASFTLPKDEAIRLNEDQVITFEGDISGIDTFLTFKVRLSNAEIVK